MRSSSPTPSCGKKRAFHCVINQNQHLVATGQEQNVLLPPSSRHARSSRLLPIGPKHGIGGAARDTQMVDPQLRQITLRDQVVLEEDDEDGILSTSQHKNEDELSQAKSSKKKKHHMWSHGFGGASDPNTIIPPPMPRTLDTHRGLLLFKNSHVEHNFLVYELQRNGEKIAGHRILLLGFLCAHVSLVKNTPFRAGNIAAAVLMFLVGIADVVVIYRSRKESIHSTKKNGGDVVGSTPTKNKPPMMINTKLKDHQRRTKKPTDDVFNSIGTTMYGFAHETLGVVGFVIAILCMYYLYPQAQSTCNYLTESYDKRGDSEDCPYTFFPMLPFAALLPVIVGQPRFVISVVIIVFGMIPLPFITTFHGDSKIGMMLNIVVMFVIAFFACAVKYIDELQNRLRFRAEAELSLHTSEIAQENEAFRKFALEITPVHLQQALFHSDERDTKKDENMNAADDGNRRSSSASVGSAVSTMVNISNDAVCLVTDIENVAGYITSMRPADGARAVALFSFMVHTQSRMFERLVHIRTIGDMNFIVGNLVKPPTMVGNNKSSNATTGGHDGHDEDSVVEAALSHPSSPISRVEGLDAEDALDVYGSSHGEGSSDSSEATPGRKMKKKRKGKSKPKDRTDVALACQQLVMCAICVVRGAATLVRKANGDLGAPVPARCAIARGPIIGTPVGEACVRYDIFGDPVDEAQELLQLCSTTTGGGIIAVAAVKELLSCSTFDVKELPGDVGKVLIEPYIHTTPHHPTAKNHRTRAAPPSNSTRSSSGISHGDKEEDEKREESLMVQELTEADDTSAPAATASSSGCYSSCSAPSSQLLQTPSHSTTTTTAVAESHQSSATATPMASVVEQHPTQAMQSHGVDQYRNNISSGGCGGGSNSVDHSSFVSGNASFEEEVGEARGSRGGGGGGRGGGGRVVMVSSAGAGSTLAGQQKQPRASAPVSTSSVLLGENTTTAAPKFSASPVGAAPEGAPRGEKDRALVHNGNESPNYHELSDDSISTTDGEEDHSADDEVIVASKITKTITTPDHQDRKDISQQNRCCGFWFPTFVDIGVEREFEEHQREIASSSFRACCAFFAFLTLCLFANVLEERLGHVMDVELYVAFSLYGVSTITFLLLAVLRPSANQEKEVASANSQEETTPAALQSASSSRREGDEDDDRTFSSTSQATQVTVTVGDASSMVRGPTQHRNASSSGAAGAARARLAKQTKQRLASRTELSHSGRLGPTSVPREILTVSDTTSSGLEKAGGSSLAPTTTIVTAKMIRASMLSCLLATVAMSLSRPSRVGDDPTPFVVIFCFSHVVMGGAIVDVLAFQLFSISLAIVLLLVFRPILTVGLFFSATLVIISANTAVVFNRLNRAMFSDHIRSLWALEELHHHHQVRTAITSALVPRQLNHLLTSNSVQQQELTTWCSDEVVVVHIVFNKPSGLFTSTTTMHHASVSGYGGSATTSVGNGSTSVVSFSNNNDNEHRIFMDSRSESLTAPSQAGGTSSVGLDGQVFDTASLLEHPHGGGNGSATSLTHNIHQRAITADYIRRFAQDSSTWVEELVASCPYGTLDIVKTFGGSFTIAGPLHSKTLDHAATRNERSLHILRAVHDALFLIEGMLASHASSSTRNEPSLGFSASVAVDHAVNVLRLTEFPNYELLGTCVSMAKALVSNIPIPPPPAPTSASASPLTDGLHHQQVQHQQNRKATVVITEKLAKLYHRECEKVPNVVIAEECQFESWRIRSIGSVRVGYVKSARVSQIAAANRSQGSTHPGRGGVNQSAATSTASHSRHISNQASTSSLSSPSAALLHTTQSSAATGPPVGNGPGPLLPHQTPLSVATTGGNAANSQWS